MPIHALKKGKFNLGQSDDFLLLKHFFVFFNMFLYEILIIDIWYTFSMVQLFATDLNLYFIEKQKSKIVG